jgi:hypothetical protein
MWKSLSHTGVAYYAYDEMVFKLLVKNYKICSEQGGLQKINITK